MMPAPTRRRLAVVLLPLGAPEPGSPQRWRPKKYRPQRPGILKPLLAVLQIKLLSKAEMLARVGVSYSSVWNWI